MINNSFNCDINMHFQSDSMIQQQGFKLRLWAFIPVTDLKNSSLVTRDESVTLYSFGYPMAYLHRMDTYQTVYQNEGPNTVLVLKFHHFDLRDNEDFLKVGYEPWHQQSGEQMWPLLYTGVIPSNFSATISARQLLFHFTSVGGMVYDHSYLIEVELQPLVVCPPGEFACKSGNQCLPVKQFCNGVPECLDGSDETNSFCKGYNFRTCGVSHIPSNIVPTDQDLLKSHPAKSGSWPWSVNLFLPYYYPFCDGTLVSTGWVLTSASCFQQRNSFYGKYFVSIGGYDVDAEEPFARNVQIAAAYINPDFKYVNGVPLEDTMLLRLAEEVPLNERINVACLPYMFDYAAPAGRKCVATGWGGIAGTKALLCGSLWSAYEQVTDLEIIGKICSFGPIMLKPCDFASEI
ncbi:unnamed protein product [Soboliphyme baturini]|uniref:Peptidase S1 domain-containing protein n=1 Tax=Soboliphyme baturini TaxID=241478 RepID=A0A183IHL6_9BILA|nr:unnamed protein product [Soboliphyme baturini]